MLSLALPISNSLSASVLWATGGVQDPACIAVIAAVPALAAAAAVCAIADIRKGVRMESLAGPPPSARWRIASVMAALLSVGVIWHAGTTGLGDRVASLLAGALGARNGGLVVVLPLAFALYAAGLSAAWGYRRRFNRKLNDAGLSLEERAERARDGVYRSLVFVAASWLSVPHSSRFVHSSLPAALTATLPPIICEAVAEALGNRRLAHWEETPDAATLERARLLTVRRGIPIREAVIDEGRWGRTARAAVFRGGRITVSRRLADVASPDEMDFALARAAIASRSRATDGGFWRMLTGGVIGAAACYASAQRGASRHGGSLAVTTITSLIFAGIAFGFAFARLLRNARRLEAEADLSALEATGSLGAAESAIRLITVGPGNEIHPSSARLNARIANLRKFWGHRDVIASNQRPDRR
ncbi:MAG TPA: hypothetical protein VGM37_05345 [Armatimonadota bacterium]|jgi:hypothetical protein